MAMGRRLKSKVAAELEFERRLALARQGSTDALGELLQGCRRYLLLTASQALESTLRPKEGASDLVQETFVIAHSDFSAFQGTTLGELLAWLHRILERRLSKQVRHYRVAFKRAVRREVSLDAPNDRQPWGLIDGRIAPSDEAALEDEKRRVRTAIERLPPDYQQVLRLRTWQLLPYAQVGPLLGRSADAAEKLWLRAVERLQVELRNIS